MIFLYDSRELVLQALRLNREMGMISIGHMGGVENLSVASIKDDTHNAEMSRSVES